MALAGKQIKNTYKDILTVNSGTDNQGIESSLKTVSDGEGVATAIQLSTTTLKIPSGKTLEIAGTLNSIDATLTGDLTVGDDLTVTDLISGNSLAISGSATVGGGFGSTGVTLATNGDISTDGDIVCNEVKSSSGAVTSTVTDAPKVKLTKTNTDNKIALTVVGDDSNDKEILEVKEDGATTIKDKAGDTKLEVKSSGTVKYKAKTTTELNALTGTSGEIAFDSTIGAFRIWQP
tara:strand:+ start:1354 stop:2055 length:702 start_codon:yes stop_codon:yes gene_type:complete